MEIVHTGCPDRYDALRQSIRFYITPEELERGYVSEVWTPKRGVGLGACFREADNIPIEWIRELCKECSYELVLPVASAPKRNYELGNLNILWK